MEEQGIEILETHFEFFDTNKHNIAPEVLISYCELLAEYCHQNDIELSFLPFSQASFDVKCRLKQVAKIATAGVGMCFTFAHFLDTNFGKYTTTKLFGTTMEEKADNEKRKIEKKKSDFMQKSKDSVDICKIVLYNGNDNDPNKKPYCEIKRDDFHKKILQEEDKESNKGENKKLDIKFKEPLKISNAKIQIKQGLIKINITKDIEYIDLIAIVDDDTKKQVDNMINNEQQEQNTLFTRNEKNELKN